MSLGSLAAATGIVPVMALASVDQDARRDVRSVLRGGEQSDVSPCSPPWTSAAFGSSGRTRPQSAVGPFPGRPCWSSGPTAVWVLVDGDHALWDLLAADVVVTSP